ncbi:MAG TPA: methyltransferase domain-containing protein [Methylomirabilota bacterium]|jgi:SAM-dependent methyltransferase
MHRKAFPEFERICSARRAGGRVLEIGAQPVSYALLCMKSIETAREKIGLNLDGPHTYRDFTILKGNANVMDCFADGYFDTVLCNAVLEHDRFFWKTLAEIRRVTRPGGLVVIGTPGYSRLPHSLSSARHDRVSAIATSIRARLPWLLWSTLTCGVHNAPGDYYRFSPQAYREVFFEAMEDITVHTIMWPLIVIGAGLKPA